MTARPDLLGLLPFADVADADPNALPYGEVSDDECQARADVAREDWWQQEHGGQS